MVVGGAGGAGVLPEISSGYSLCKVDKHVLGLCTISRIKLGLPEVCGSERGDRGSCGLGVVWSQKPCC